MKEYIGEEFQELILEDQSVEKCVFEDYIFENCKFQELLLKGCLFSGCVFIKCRFSGLHIKNTEALGNTFRACSLTGVNWSDLLEEKKREMGFLPFDLLERCTVRHSVFYRLNLRKFDFTGCDLAGSYFDECDLSESSFRETLLKGSSFSQNNLSAADFRGAADYCFSLTNNRAQKAKFSLPEAVNLLAALGIVIED